MVNFYDLSLDNKNRLILDTPFSTKSTISYGLIVYACDTKHWVLIQRKHSVEFLLIMRGLYRITYLPLLLSCITPHEASILYQCISSDKHTFADIFLDELDLNKKELTYAQTRFEETKTIISYLLSKLNLSYNKLKWTWPKGRLLISDQKETPFACAKREFTEEVEITLPLPLFVSDSFVTESIKTITGRSIESRYWIYIIPHEIPITTPNNHPEVSSRKWVSTDECKILIQHNKLFEQVSSIVNSMHL